MKKMPKNSRRRSRVSKKVHGRGSRAEVKAPVATPVLTREQQMDVRARVDFEAMAKVNNDKSIEHKIMGQPGRSWEPQPSDRSQGGGNEALTFSQAGPRLADNAFIRSRQRF